MTRGSVRLRLTVLFASLFIAAGAGLLGITYGLLSHANNQIISVRIASGSPLGSAPGQVPANSGSASSGSASSSGGLALISPGAAGPALPDLQQAQATQAADVTR
ncbi:MAG TPA: hypothetical protein VFE59_24780, partial [Trebonia sp.]|nr:hypothetical protein [Trebonia sp.]